MLVNVPKHFRLYSKLFSSCIGHWQVRSSTFTLWNLHRQLQTTSKGGTVVDHQTLVEIFPFFSGFVKQAICNLYILLCKSIRLWVMQRAGNMGNTECLHDTCECLWCITWIIVWYKGIRPSIFGEHYLALVCSL